MAAGAVVTPRRCCCPRGTQRVSAIRSSRLWVPRPALTTRFAGCNNDDASSLGNVNGRLRAAEADHFLPLWRSDVRGGDERAVPRRVMCAVNERQSVFSLNEPKGLTGGREDLTTLTDRMDHQQPEGEKGKPTTLISSVR